MHLLDKQIKDIKMGESWKEKEEEKAQHPEEFESTISRYAGASAAVLQRLPYKLLKPFKSLPFETIIFFANVRSLWNHQLVKENY